MIIIAAYKHSDPKCVHVGRFCGRGCGCGAAVAVAVAVVVVAAVVGVMNCGNVLLSQIYSHSHPEHWCANYDIVAMLTECNAVLWHSVWHGVIPMVCTQYSRD